MTLVPSFKNQDIVYIFNGDIQGIVVAVIYGVNGITYRVTWSDGTFGEYSAVEITAKKNFE